MTGRGIDQILLHPCDPLLPEAYVKSAGDYVRLAEQMNGGHLKGRPVLNAAPTVVKKRN
jgi:hypothetical protein